LKHIRFFFVLRSFFPKAKDIRPIKFFQKFEISLLFASNKFEEKMTSKKERRILHFRLARARGVLSWGSRKESVVVIRYE